MSPWEMGNSAEKIVASGNSKLIITERGSSFGYQNLVVDVRSFPILRKLGFPVVFDVTHSVQLPGGAGYSWKCMRILRTRCRMDRTRWRCRNFLRWWKS